MAAVAEKFAYHVELLIAVRDDRDKQAFAKLFDHFAPRVKSFLMKGGTDIGMAEECAQEVMVTVWQKAHLYDPMRATASTWIFTIARNKRIDALRKQNRPEPQDLYWMEDSEPDTAEIVGLPIQKATADCGLPEGVFSQVVAVIAGEHDGGALP